MSPRAFEIAIAAPLALPGSAAAQDPAWKVIRPNITWDAACVELYREAT